MYAGHAAIALIIKARRPATPMVPLALACYGPDFVDIALMIPHPREGMAIYSHSIAAVVIGAALAWLARVRFSGGVGAKAIALGWLLHWPADALTGVKPLLGLDTLIGLDLYHLGFTDVALEAVPIGVATAMCLRVWGPGADGRRVALATGAALFLAQVAFMIAMKQADPLTWTPRLVQ